MIRTFAVAAPLCYNGFIKKGSTIMAIYVTGDTHGRFNRIWDFSKRYSTHRSDIMIILGDAGINFAGGERDEMIKRGLKNLRLQLLCVHGNHEMRPESVGSYEEIEWHGGTVYVEPQYPNLLFAKDGEIYDIAYQKCIAIGGAYSVDKPYRLANGWPWFADEQPSEEIKSRVEQRLETEGWQVDIVLSHTCPLKYEPRETFMQGIDQSAVDNSTEIWLNSIEERLTYKRWYAGHYHVAKYIDRMRFLFEDYRRIG